MSQQVKENYRIGEVAALAEIEPHVLRYWETEFPALHPIKTAHGQRLYRPQDIEVVLTIKRLLYEQGFTIAGARRQLEHLPGNGEPPLPAAEPGPAANASLEANGHRARQQLREIRAELERLLTLLSRR
ncbi:MAG: MerR family transcriptional regulator [Candidatus Acidiferrales bacterium]